jgi:hypothetical protein
MPSARWTITRDDEHNLDMTKWRVNSLQVLFLLAVLSGAARSAAADDGEPSAEAVLKMHGLTRQGRLWILPEEQELRDRLATLKRCEDRHREAAAYVERLLEANRNLSLQITRVDETLKKDRELNKSAQPGTAQKKQLETEIKNYETLIEQLRKQYIPPDKLGLASPLKPALVDLVNARAEATLKFLVYRDTPADLPQRYERLKNDSTVAAALAALPTPDRLGPDKTVCDGWRACVDRLDGSLLNDNLPVYREGNVYRFTAIVNDRRPLTFSFGNQGEPMVIPQNLAETAGIMAPADAKKVTYHVAEGRDVPALAVQIPQLRLGRNVAKNVNALILPPEAADIGARIGPDALPGYRPRIDAARLLLIIEGTKR